MKVAYLVLAHKNPRLLKKAIAALSSEDSGFFVHIDRKNDIGPFSQAGSNGNVVFLENRIPVYWGEFSGVEAELLLIRRALEDQHNYDYFILLGGADYPLRSPQYIQKFLQRNSGTEFMNLVKVPNKEAGKPLSRIKTVVLQSNQPMRRLAVRALAKLGLAQREYREYLGNLEPYSGSTWWGLTRDACHYLLEFVERSPRVSDFFRNVFAPDESFFPTILGSSRFGPQIRRNLLFEDWSRRGAHPAMIEERHIAYLEKQETIYVHDVYGSGEVLFARKFSDENLELLNRIDDMIAREDKQWRIA
jgi:hypothetical protein